MNYYQTSLIDVEPRLSDILNSDQCYEDIMMVYQ